MYICRGGREGGSGAAHTKGVTGVGGNEATSKQKARSGENDDKLRCKERERESVCVCMCVCVCVCVCVKDDTSVGENG